MGPSPCDQKRAEIVSLVEKQCLAEIDTAKAEYDLECLEVKEKYESKKQQACRSLSEQESKELAEKKRLYEAKMEPIKAKHAEKLAATREKYRTVSIDYDPLASGIPETLSSPDLGVAVPELGEKNPASSNNPLYDSQESGDETDTSIPAFAPLPVAKAKTNATLAVSLKKRKRLPSLESGNDDDDELDSSQNEIGGEQDDISDIAFQNSPVRPSRKVLKPVKRASAHQFGQNNVSSAPPRMMRNDPSHNELNNGLDSWNNVTSPIHSGQAGRDEDKSNYSDPALQGPRRGARRGRPEPGKYRINAGAFPKFNMS